MKWFTNLLASIRQVIRRMLPLRSVEQVEQIESPLSSEMVNALDTWYNLYRDQPDWVKSDDTVKSMNLPALIASEIARQVTLEVKWNITGKTPEPAPQPPVQRERDTAQGEKSAGDPADRQPPKPEVPPEPVDNERSKFLKEEFGKLMAVLRQKLEPGCAAGGMAIRPYPVNGHFAFGYTMDWSLYPVAFDSNGELSDVIFRDTFQEGQATYTRLERHAIQANGDLKITQRAFKSSVKDNIGVEVPLTSVDRWANLEPEATLHGFEGQLFGWFKVAAANNVDVDSPMGISVFHKAINVIKQADMQYSRLLWEYEASEMAIDVDPMALRPVEPPEYSGAGEQKYEMPKLKDRLFRGVNVQMGDNSDLYKVFAPTIRDASLLNGLNRLLMMVEDLTGLSRGTLSDAPLEARTATELRILRQRTYATVADNQAALEKCLRDVVRAMDKLATLYQLAPEGDYEVSFEWDDSILTDRTQEMGERLELMSQGVIGKPEMRQWYTGETASQAEAAILKIQTDAARQTVAAMLAQSRNNPRQDETDADDNPDLERPDLATKDDEE